MDDEKSTVNTAGNHMKEKLEHIHIHTHTYTYTYTYTHIYIYTYLYIYELLTSN